MINWFAEPTHKSAFQRYGIWGVALLISLLFNWVAAEQMGENWLNSARKTIDREHGELVVTIDPSFHRFVEANPNVPVNEPDPTPNFAARDQQAAQETPDPLDDSQFPELEAEEESQTLLDRGDVADFEPGLYSEQAEATPDVPDQQGMGELLPEAQREIPDWVDRSNVGEGDRIPEPRRSTEEQSDTTAENPSGWIALDDGPAQQTRTEQQTPTENTPEARPMPRKRIGADVLAAPLNRSGHSASRQGRIAVESKLTDFGDYTQRALEAIQAEWHRLIREVSPHSSSSFTRVRIRFDIQEDGNITNARVEETSAGELATMICLDAVHARAPYGKWTEDMRSTLGDRTTMRITFNYY